MSLPPVLSLPLSPPLSLSLAIIEGESTVDAERLANFCRAIAGGMKQNQYHNAVHVIDVRHLLPPALKLNSL